MTLHFLTFPTELLVKIFLALDAKSICCCSQTSRLFQNIIRNSIELQCQLAFVKYGCTFNPDAQGSLYDQYHYLQRKEDSWWSGNPIKVWDLNPPNRLSGIYDLCGGHYILGDSTRRNIYTLNLRDPDSSWNRIQLASDIVDFGLAIHEHDMMAMISYERTPADQINLMLHIRSFSTNENHPEAKEPTLLVHTYENVHTFLPPQIGIEIVGDYLILIVINIEVNDGRRGARDYLFIFDWRKGQCVLHSAFHGLYWSPLIVSSKLIAFVNCKACTLDFFPLEPDYFSKHQDSWTPLPSLQLALPTLHPGSRIVYVINRCEPNPNEKFPYGAKSGKDIVMQNPDNAIATFYIHIVPHTAIPLTVSFAFYVHRSTLIRVYHEYLPGYTMLPGVDSEEALNAGVEGSQAVEYPSSSVPDIIPATFTLPPPFPPHILRATARVEIPVPWTEWGQENVRIFNNSYPSSINTDWVTTSSGERVVRYGPAGIYAEEDEEDIEVDEEPWTDESDSDGFDHMGFTSNHHDSQPSVSLLNSLVLHPYPEPLPNTPISRNPDLEILDFSAYSIYKAKHSTSPDPDNQLSEVVADEKLYDPMQCFLNTVYSRLPYVRKWMYIASSLSSEKGVTQQPGESIDEEDRFDGVLMDEENLILVKNEREREEGDTGTQNPGSVRLVKFV